MYTKRKTIKKKKITPNRRQNVQNAVMDYYRQQTETDKCEVFILYSHDFLACDLDGVSNEHYFL